MSDTVQQIKERLSIQEVIAPYVKLTRAGKSLVGLCPFHKEKTASFHVSVERGSFHCFGCGVGGDAFSFVEKVEGVDFKGALKMLADKAGVTVVYSDRHGSGDASKKDRLRTLLHRASEWYASQLRGSAAEAYAKKRSISDETISAWRLGYAPDGWRALLETLAAEGFSTAELLAAGLIKEADGKRGTYYDRFRNRLMFPIRDSAGRVVGFTGRVLPSTALAKEGSVEPAKYLNSPETELYRKSEILFGMDRAKDKIRTRNFTLLVEGQMDVLLAHQAGFENAVALSGTALSEKHLGLMKRFSENLMLVLDADAAGLSATAKSAALALRQGLRVKAVRLPSGKDPADLLLEDPKEFAKRIAAGKPIVEFFLAELSERERDPHRLLRLAEAIVLPLIAAIPSPMEREHFIAATARSLSLSGEAVRESLNRLPKSPEVKEDVLETVAPRAARSARDARAEQLLAVLIVYSGTALAQRVKAEYLRITEARELPPDIPPEPALFLCEQMFADGPKEDAADELLQAFEDTIVRGAYQEAVAKLRRAEAAGDPAAVAQAHAECRILSARLGALSQGGAVPKR